MAESLKEAFRRLDKDGDGSISPEELEVILRELGDWTDDEFEQLFGECDVDGNGKLNVEEFIDFIMAISDNDAEVANEVVLDALDDYDSGGDYGEGGESEEEGSDWDEYYEDEDEWDLLGEDPVDIPIGEAEPEPSDDSGKFEDPDFPATQDSLGVLEGDTASGVAAGDAANWIRLLDYVGEDGSLFKDVNSHDVQQGGLGNCWFLASCASIAAYPAWIKQVFSKNPSLRADGKYEIRLFHPGRKEFFWQTVSDEVPADDEGEPTFSSPTTEKEIWPCLLEKAMSKFSKTYAATEGGFTAWGMLYICGGEGENWDKEDGSWIRSKLTWNGGDGDQVEDRNEAEGFDDTKDSWDDSKLWTALLAYAGKNFPMCCSIGDEKDDMQGLISGHAYSFIAVRTVVSNGKALKMCKIRNPHGETEWTGKWSDGSDMWDKHPNVKKELKFRPKEDGSFWMAFHDFTKYFDTVAINKQSMPLDGVHVDKLRANVAGEKSKPAAH
eukprot:TRINITY_DN9323_c0_g1_i1.p1 TRINITY_DN9323_c0_g1~~TRINITY_DN9323_c0_g1_i1.p1  ORF type:complete len:496 (-),score=118.78 TRINITY_DN9323_c0_g1_i1:138-1625(-)